MADLRTSQSAASGLIDQVIEPRIFERVKGFKLRRVLANAPTVGPFVLFDHFGPVSFGVGQGLDAGPHPHVGMATLTYLFEGSLLHRDSTGNTAPLTPGGANWMVCGRGIAHSERTPPEARQAPSRLHGVQLWLALPRAHEEDEPRFEHQPASALPVLQRDGCRLRVIAGSFEGTCSPLPTLSGTLCVHAELAAGARLELSGQEHQERSFYVVSGEVALGDERLRPERLVVLKRGAPAVISALAPTHLLLLGGERLDSKHMWSTVVTGNAQRIDRAKADWSEGRIPSVVGEPDRGAFPPAM